jgi:hypothetical protein
MRKHSVDGVGLDILFSLSVLHTPFYQMKTPYALNTHWSGQPLTLEEGHIEAI